MEIIFLHLGEFTLAQDHYEKALSCSTILTIISMMLSYMCRTQGSRCGVLAAWSLWFLGQPDQALERIHEAVDLARELFEPHGLAQALFFAAVLHQLRRRTAQGPGSYAEAAIAVVA